VRFADGEIQSDTDWHFRIYGVREQKVELADAVEAAGTVESKAPPKPAEGADSPDARRGASGDARANDPVGGDDRKERSVGGEVGDLAPEVKAQTLNGKPIRLADFRGKYVLLEFWATWCGPCIGETPSFEKTWKAFGDHPPFVLLAVSLDNSSDAARRYVEEHDLGWTQAWLGKDAGWAAVRSFGRHGIPSVFLIGPDGRIVAANLRGDRIINAVRDALPTVREASKKD
jgi:peroxiredoxin